MTDEKRRQSSAAFHRKRKAAGWVQRTTWLDPDAVSAVEKHTEAVGSGDEVIRRAIKAWKGPE